MRTRHRIDCHKCRHYYITWEPRQPHGCRAMGFKSHALPGTVVYQSSGCECKAFEPKKRLAAKTKNSSSGQ